jgi:alcohol dehydrogenase class IV
MTDINILPHDLWLPRQIVHGWGRRAELPALTRELGSRAWLVLGSRSLEQSGIVAELTKSFQQVGTQVELIATQTGEPTVQQVDAATRALRMRIDQLGPASGHWLLAIGGGSAIDLAKAVAAMLTNAHGASVAEFLEGIGTGRTITNTPLPVVAVPTTAGTGSEATKNAVITSLQPPAKKSLRSNAMIPSIVVIDPELTVSVPKEITAWTGMDALTQLIESYLTKKSNAFTSSLCLAGLKDFVPALRTAYHEPTNRAAREKLAQAALYSGIALANSGLGLAHGVAAGLGALHQTPHGLACALMLGPTLHYNQSVCETKYLDLARVICGQNASVSQLLTTIQELADELHVPRRLRDVGVTISDLPALVVASQGNSLNGNPRAINTDELLALLKELQ